MKQTASVLIVEDEAIVAWEIERSVRELGLRVGGVAASAEEALRCVDAEVPDLAVMDVRLRGEVDGIDLAMRLYQQLNVPSVMLTANGDDATTRRAQGALPVGYLLKPFKASDLKRTIELALVRRRAEQQLALTVRLGTVKVLAGGVAHEVNNPLAMVSANVSWALETLQGALGPMQLTELRAALEEAQQGVARISTIVSDLITFSATTQEPGHTLVEAAVVWARRATGVLCRTRAQVEVEVEPGLAVVMTDVALAQVLVQLLTNAAQAIPLNSLAPQRIGLRAYSTPAGVVELEVTDTGEGVTLEDEQRAFDPFFTKRGVGQGRGLGLSVCQGLVEAVGGSIRFDRTRVRSGCCVVVSLPRAT